MPLTMPIFGSLNGYGCLEDIEEDDHTRWLEKRLKMPIYDFARAVCYGENVPQIKKIAKYIFRHETPRFRDRLKWDGTVRGCFVAREAWDEFSAKTWDECGKPDSSAYDAAWVDQCTLNGMGFVLAAKNTEQAKKELGSSGGRYNTPYTHPKLPGVVVWCDEHMNSEATYLGKKIDTFYRVIDFDKSLKKVGLRLPHSSVAWAKQNSSIFSSIMSGKNEYNVFRDMKKRYADDIRLTRISVDVDEDIKEKFKSRVKSMMDGVDSPDIDTSISKPYSEVVCGFGFHVNLTADSIGGNPTTFLVEKVDHKETCGFDHSWVPNIKFTDEVWSALKDLGFKEKSARKQGFSSTLSNRVLSGFCEEYVVIYRKRLFSDDTIRRMIEVERFCHNMSAANKLLQPTICGYQYGDPYAELLTAKMAMKLAQNKIDEIKKYR